MRNNITNKVFQILFTFCLKYQTNDTFEISAKISNLIIQNTISII